MPASVWVGADELAAPAGPARWSYRLDREVVYS
jgi:hypothetical protein